MFIDAVSEAAYDPFVVLTEDREKTTLPKTDGKTRTVFEKNRVLLCSNVEVAASWGGTVRADYEWGGNGGCRGSLSVSGEAKDDKGNSLEVEVKQHSDGSGNASVSVTHTENKEE